MSYMILDFVKERDNKYRNLVTEYLKSNNAPSYYMVNYLSDDEGDDAEPFTFKALTEEQCDEIKALMKHCEDEGYELRHHFYEEGIPEYLQFDGYIYGCTPTSVEFDTRYVTCRLKVAAFYDGIDAAPTVNFGTIYLSEEEYIDLIRWQMYNRKGNFNDLFEDNVELATSINSMIREFWTEELSCGCSPLSTPIFAVELVESKEAAEAILGEPDVHFRISTERVEDVVDETLLDIEDRVLSFLHNHSTREGYNNLRIKDVDAIAVERAMGVESYRDIALRLTEQFGGKEGVDKFREFLDQHNITYTIDKGGHKWLDDDITDVVNHTTPEK